MRVLSWAERLPAAHVPTDGGQRESAEKSTMDAGFPVYAVCQVRAAESVEEHEQI